MTVFINIKTLETKQIKPEEITECLTKHILNKEFGYVISTEFNRVYKPYIDFENQILIEHKQLP